MTASSSRLSLHNRLSTRTLHRSTFFGQSKTARQSKAQSAMIGLRLACIIASTMRPGARINKQHSAICVGDVPDGRLHSLLWESVGLSRTLALSGSRQLCTRRREVVTKKLALMSLDTLSMSVGRCSGATYGPELWICVWTTRRHVR